MKPLTLLLFALFVASCSPPRLIIYQDPLSAQEHVDLGYIYERQGKLELAQEEYKKAIRKDKREWRAYFNLGNTYAKLGKYEEAKEFYEKALELKKDPDIYNNLAYTLYQLKDYCGALFYAKKALEKGSRREYEETYREVWEKV
ncbi:MAG: tetratricopeptide repeat protein, partial [Aquificota bacterium]